jgi:hypothetical protein
MQNLLTPQLIGTWKLISWIYTDDLGETVHYFGEDARGILLYDACGYMSAQLMRAGREPFREPGFARGTPDETRRAFHSYFAYYGRYYEKKPGEIVHVVEGSLFPNWVGQREVRYATVKDDRLTLYTLPIAAEDRKIVFYITWERVRLS